MGEQEHHSSKSIGRRLHLLHRWFTQYIAEELGDLGIGSGQFPFLMALFHEDGVTQEHLTEMVQVDKATTTRAVQKLVKEGYVTKKVDPKDHRAHRIYLTPKAKKLKPRLKRTLKKSTQMLTKDLSEDEKDTLRDLLDKMVANAPVKGCQRCEDDG